MNLLKKRGGRILAVACALGACTGMLSCSDDKKENEILTDVSLRTITSHVSLSSGGYGEIEFAITPLDYEPDLRIAGGDANLTLVLTDAAGNLTDSSPVNYKLVNVAKVVSSEGESMPGRYKATVQDYYKSTSYKEYASLVLSVGDYNGLSGRAVSGPVEISYGSDAALYSVEVGGVSASKGDDGVFYVKLPAGKNVSSMPAKFAFGGALLEVLEPDGSYRQSGKTDNLDMTAPVTLRVTTVDGEQNEYRLIGCYSNLPVVYITTPQPVMSKDNWVKNCVMEIWHAGEHNGRYETSVKGRGNSTWGMPKKPYAIKLDKKAKVLGMPKHKRWVLLANWKDRTLLRNDVAFEIARQLPALDWTPRGDFVDVVMNGKFAGNYYLGEQIKVDENRVPVTEMESADIAGNDITGGYLLELDIHYDEVNKFRTPYKDFPVNFKSPDEDVLVPAQFDYVKNYFAEMEEILYGENADNKDIFDYIDMDSFIDWWLAHELSYNTDCSWPKSAYMHKERGEKMKAGPVWDFDWGTFRPVAPAMDVAATLYYDRLFQNPVFVARVKQRWADHKVRLTGVPDYIRAKAAYIKESADVNISLWPIDVEDNGDEHLDFDGAINRMVKAYEQRYEQIDHAISNM